MPGIVARVRPRASKGITDLLLLSVSDGFRAVDPSKKSYIISGGLGVYDPGPPTTGVPSARAQHTEMHHTHAHPKLTEPPSTTGARLTEQDPTD